MGRGPGWYWYRGDWFDRGEVDGSTAGGWAIVLVQDDGTTCGMGGDIDPDDWELMEQQGQFVPAVPPQS